ncbi:MAG: MazG-like family protein [Verrucomicrobiae bacterium]|nr:MazG-like family protein [Verrucomicrobiae bacterium]
MEFNQITSKILAFRDARDWRQFHKANHLAAAIAIESAELQEHFLWQTPAEVKAKISNPIRRLAVGEELADVLIYALLLAHEMRLDPAEIITSKLVQNEKKYPVVKARGRSTKYTEL